MVMMRRVVMMVLMCFALTECAPPRIQYPQSKLVTARRATLQQNLLQLLPAEQRTQQAAKKEAQWLADTAYKAAAGISRVNASHFPGWAGNFLINGRIQDRGLCWHYQHDMYRELRRRELEYFKIGCCVRDKAERSEHNCVYICAKDDEWPNVWVLDAWLWNGRLKVSYGPTLDENRWGDLPDVTDYLSNFYEEGHHWPVEHWFMVRAKNGKYSLYSSKEGKESAQYRRMMRNIQKGYREHPGSPVNY